MGVVKKIVVEIPKQLRLQLAIN